MESTKASLQFQFGNTAEEIRLLKKTFLIIDKNGDGQLDKDEINQFLRMKGVEEDQLEQIVDDLFSKCD